MSTDFLRTRKALVAVVAILVLGSGVWGVTTLSKNKKTTLPKELSAEALKADSADPHKMYAKVHEAMEKGNLTDAQREELRNNLHNIREAHENQRMDEYFKAPAAQKQAVLDRQIDEMQVRAKEWQQRRAEREAQNGAAGANSSAGGSAGGGSAGGATGTANANASGGTQGRDGGRGWSGRDGQRTREQRKTRSESRNPDERARHMAYWSAVQQRAQQRGIQTPMWGGRDRH